MRQVVDGGDGDGRGLYAGYAINSYKPDSRPAASVNTAVNAYPSRDASASNPALHRDNHASPAVPYRSAGSRT